MKMKEFTKMMFFVSTGFIAGAAVGVLLAPDKGEVTLDKLKKKASVLGDDVTKKYEEEIELLKEKINSLKDQFTNGVMASLKEEKVKEEKVKEDKAK
jgi:gas vesicle protein